MYIIVLLSNTGCKFFQREVIRTISTTMNAVYYVWTQGGKQDNIYRRCVISMSLNIQSKKSIPHWATGTQNVFGVNTPSGSAFFLAALRLSYFSFVSKYLSQTRWRSNSPNEPHRTRRSSLQNIPLGPTPSASLRLCHLIAVSCAASPL